MELSLEYFLSACKQKSDIQTILDWINKYWGYLMEAISMFGDFSVYKNKQKLLAVSSIIPTYLISTFMSLQWRNKGI